MRAWRVLVLLVLIPLVAVPARPQDEQPCPRLLGPRRAAERTKALRQNGGGAATEKAVAAGLDWLARHEAPGGGWDADGFSGQCEEGPECDGIGKGQHGEAVPCPFDDAITRHLATISSVPRNRSRSARGNSHTCRRSRGRRRPGRCAAG